MNIFHCDHCQQLVFFENVYCLSCHHPLAYLPDLGEIGSLEQTPQGVWRSPAPSHNGKEHLYRLCANYDRDNVCNWAIPADDPHDLCSACRLTTIIPDLSVPANKEAWYRLEVAKRRLVYSLLQLKLPVSNKTDDPALGLAFEFLAAAPNSKPVFTGHDDGVITINIAEADDVQREKQRLQWHEPYRTLLGHFRHESGHYYWDRLIKDSPSLLQHYRELFGDERRDYQEALNAHYQQGAPADWQQSFISTYATSHPWEDWAETWAHYLHIVDALETATAVGLSLQPKRKDEPAMTAKDLERRPSDFERMIDKWYPLTYALNNFSRGLGHADSYPFVLSPPVVAKLKFVHDCIDDFRRQVQQPSNQPAVHTQREQPAIAG